MNHTIKTFISGRTAYNSVPQDIGFLLLRFFTGLALCTVFEKLLPKSGIWGPQDWFIHDVADMGFPFPVFFAWIAVLSEFIGGILLMLGLYTRPAAIMNVMVTFTATFIYHDGDLSGSGLFSFFFMIMCICIVLFGPGKFSMEHLLARRRPQTKTVLLTLVLLFLSGSSLQAGNTSPQLSFQQQAASDNCDSLQVEFFLRNNSLLSKKYTFIIYNPEQEGNNTIVKWVLPYIKVKFELPVGSKIYIATKSQVNTVMQGKRIDGDQPFLIVDKTMKKSTLQLNRRGKYEDGN